MQRKETNSELRVTSANDEFVPSVQAAKTQGCHKCTKTYGKQQQGILTNISSNTLHTTNLQTLITSGIHACG